MSLHDLLRGDIIPLSGLSVSIGRNVYDSLAPTVPINDVHHRSMNLYAGLSGIITYYSLLRHLGVIPNQSGVQTIVPGDVICVSRAGADISIEEGTFAALAFDTINVNTNSKLYSTAASGIIRVHASGIYDIGCHGSFANDTTTDRISRRLSIQKLSPLANETGFVEIPGTRSWVYLHNLIPGDNTAFSRCIVSLQAGDLIQAVVNAQGPGAAVLGLSIIASGCGLTMEKLQ